MNRTTGTFLAIVVCAVLAAVVFSLTDFLGGKVYASPEEVLAASHAALRKKDLRTWCECLTDESRDFMAVEPVIFSFKGTYAAAETNEKKAELAALKEVQDKHGLTEAHLAKLVPEKAALEDRPRGEDLERFAQKVLAPVSDRNAFCAEMYAVVLKDADPVAAFGPFADGKLSNVKVEGNVAVGAVSMSSDRPPIRIVFRKQGDGWRIDFLASMEQQKRPGPGFKHPQIN
jgi:hypothetical protein